MNEDNSKKVEITIDNKATEELVKYLKEKDEKKNTENDLAERKIQVIKKFGHPEIFLEATTNEELVKLTTQYINELAGKNASGVAPMNSRQMGEDRMRFSSREEMIRYLRAHKDEIVSDGGLTGADVLRIGFGTAIQEMKSGKTIEGFNPNPQTSEKDSKSAVEVSLGPNMKPTQRSEIREALDRADELAREKLKVSRDRAVAINQKKRENEQ